MTHYCNHSAVYPLAPLSLIMLAGKPTVSKSNKTNFQPLPYQLNVARGKHNHPECSHLKNFYNKSQITLCITQSL